MNLHLYDRERNILDENVIRTYNKGLLRRNAQEDQFTEEYNFDWWQDLLLDVISTLEEVRISNAHRAAACDALTGLLKGALRSDVSEWSSFCTSPVIWKRVLSVYFDRCNDASARFMKQIMDVLMTMLVRQHATAPKDFDICIDHATSMCIQHLATDTAAKSCRPSMMVLERLLVDKLITSLRIVNTFNEYHARGMEAPFDSLFEKLVFRILLWARNPDLARVCGKLLGSLCSQNFQTILNGSDDPMRPKNSWLMPVKTILSDHPEIIDALEKYVLPNLLKVDTGSNTDFARGLPLLDLWQGNTYSVNELDARLCLMVLSVSADHRLELPTKPPGVSVESSFSADMTPSSFTERVYANLLSHPDSEIRLRALSSLINQKQAAQPLSLFVMSTLEQQISQFFGETDAKIRNEFLAHVKRLFKRMENLAWRLNKASDRQATDKERTKSHSTPAIHNEDVSGLLRVNVNFLQFYETLILEELNPTASFQQHILALKALSFLQTLRLPAAYACICSQITSGTHSGGDIQLRSELQSSQLLALFDLTMDPYEDVRATAAKIISNYEPNRPLLLQAISNTEVLMRTSGRADHADGFGRLVQLKQIWLSRECMTECPPLDDGPPQILDKTNEMFRSAIMESIYNVEHSLSVAEIDLKKAIVDAPLHGNIIALRYLTSQFTLLGTSHNIVQTTNGDVQTLYKVCDEISNICHRIWSIVYPILCNDSPEGTDFFDGDEDTAIEVGIKDTLSYAWRALKESSLLMLSLFRLCERNKSLEAINIASFGDLIFSQLAQLRHRGAFSAVAQAFASFTSLCQQMVNASGPSIIQSLYSKTLDCVEEKGNALTRRSAGLPALIVGILCADPGGQLMVQALSDLRSIAHRRASDENAAGLPQVHALNCLKDIFLHSKLGPEAEPQFAEVLEIAVECLDNDIWAIRNSGLMLLKALLVRLEEGRLGSNTLYKTSSKGIFSRAAYAKHPSLIRVLLRLLNANTSSSSPQSTEAESRLIEQTFPAMEIIERVGVPDSARDEVISSLKHYLSSRVWAMRLKSASCLALLISGDGIQQALKEAVQGLSQNQLHGALLLVRHSLRESPSKEGIHHLWRFLKSNFVELVLACTSPLTEEILFDVLCQCVFCLSAGISYPQKYIVQVELAANFASFADNMEILELSITHGYSVPVKTKFRTLLATLNGDGYQALKEAFSAKSNQVSTVVGALAICQQPGHQPDIKAITECIRSLSTNQDDDATEQLLDLLSRSLLLLLDQYSLSTPQVDYKELFTFCQNTLKSCCKQVVLNKVVEIWGLLVAAESKTASPGAYNQNFERWIALLNSSMKNLLEMDVRQAALSSIEGFTKVMRTPQQITARLDQILTLLLVVYDGVVDDDDDIRSQAAAIASWLCLHLSERGEATQADNDKLCGPALSPLAAQRSILNILALHSRTCKSLVSDSLRRVIGENIDSFLALSFPHRLAAARLKAQTLFDEERQNQYIDASSELNLWNKLLTEAGKHFKLEPVIADALVAWSITGVSELLRKLENDRSEEFLGPMGHYSLLDVNIVCQRLFALTTWLLGNADNANVDLLRQLGDCSRSLVQNLQGSTRFKAVGNRRIESNESILVRNLISACGYL